MSYFLKFLLKFAGCAAFFYFTFSLGFMDLSWWNGSGLAENTARFLYLFFVFGSVVYND